MLSLGAFMMFTTGGALPASSTTTVLGRCRATLACTSSRTARVKVWHRLRFECTGLFLDELWSPGYEQLKETVARVADFLTAKAAYEALVERRPGEPIVLRQGARVVQKSSKEFEG
jgi:hypothetical protein